MQDTVGGARTNSKATFSYGPLHIDALVLDDQLEFIYINYARTEDVA